MASNVFEAITAVMADVAYVQKEGRMDAPGQKYKFARAEDIVAALRPSMVKHGLCMFPTSAEKEIDETYETARGGKMNRVGWRVQFVIAHGASNTTCTVVGIGEAADSGDKACNKAMTAANKYALRQAFQIETGDDDPDKHASADQERAALPAKNGNAANGLTSAERFDVAKVKIRASNDPTEIDKLMAYASRLNKDGVFDDRQLKLLELECNIRRTSLEQMATAAPM